MVWEAISNIRKGVSSDIQTPWSWLKKTRLRLVFSTTSRCLDIVWNTLPRVWYITSVADNQDTLLPVITADISGQTGLYKRGNVILDSEAQISFIRMETAESLGLEGNNVPITITKVGGEEQEMKTKEFKVQVTSLSNKWGFLIKAGWNSANQRWCIGNHKKSCYRTYTTDRKKDSPRYRTSRPSYWKRPCTPAH